MNGADLDLSEFTLALPAYHASGKLRVRGGNRGEPFLRGPIPLAWLHVAASLPGKALHIGVELWFLVGVKRSSTVRVSLSRLQVCRAVSRYAASRGLRSLERAGLVSVERHAGRKPVVTVTPVTSAEQRSSGGGNP